MRNARCLVSALALLGAVHVFAQNQLSNPGFEIAGKTEVPSAWSCTPQPSAPLICRQDTDVKFTGNASLRLESVQAVSEKLGHRVFQTAKLKPAAELKTALISCQMRGQGLQGASIVLIGATEQNPSALWKQFFIRDGDFDWYSLGEELTVPEGLEKLRVEIRLKGPGVLWVDDISLQVVDYRFRLEDDKDNWIKNPGFEEVDSTGMPFNWRRTFQQGSRITAVASEDVKFEGKRALKVEMFEPLKTAAPHIIQQFWDFEPLSVTKYCDVSFMLKGQDLSRAAIVIVADTEAKPNIVWKVFHLPQGTFDWQKYTASVAVPPGVKTMRLHLRFRNAGIAWFDNVIMHVKDFTPETIGLEGELDMASRLPGQWKEKKITGNENISNVAIEDEGGRRVAVQSWKGGSPLSGFQVPLPVQYLKAPVFEVSGEIRTVADGAARIGAEFYDGKGNLMGSASSDVPPSKTWAPYSVHFQPPADAASAQVLLMNTGKGDIRCSAIKIAMGDSTKAVRVELPAISAQVIPVDFSPLQLKVTTLEFNTFADSPRPLSFEFKAVKERLKNPMLVIDLPANIRVWDAACPHPSVTYWKQEHFTSEPLKRPEGDYRRWRCESPKALEYAGTRGYHQHCALAVLVAPETLGESLMNQKVFWHLENNGESTPEKSFVMNILPPMPKTPNPKRFQFIRWNDEELTFADKDAFLASIRCMEEAGYTWATRYDHEMTAAAETRRILSERGWRFFIRRCVPNIHNRNSCSEGTGIKIPAPIMADGSVKPGSEMCPTYLVASPELMEPYDKYVRKLLGNCDFAKGDWLILDSEQWSPMDWCFCDTCRGEFAKQNHLENVPSIADIREKYRVEWREFRIWHDREYIKRAAKYADEFGFDLMDYNYIIDYSKPDYRDFFFRIPKDARGNEPYQAGHLQSYYYTHDSRAFDAMRMGLTQLKKSYYPMCGVSASPSWQSPVDVLSPSRFRMMLLTAAVTGCPGFAIYPGTALDAKFILAGDSAMEIVAAVEDYFRDGSVVPFEVKAEVPFAEENFRSLAWTLNGKTLLSLLNYHPESSATVQLTLPDGVKAVRRLNQSTWIPLTASKEMTLSIAPHDACFLELAQ